MAVTSIKNQIYRIHTEGVEKAVLKDLVTHPFQLELTDDAAAKINHCRHYLNQKLAQSDSLFYGINTGFGR
jgi:histidine ammonia-lyase